MSTQRAVGFVFCALVLVLGGFGCSDDESATGNNANNVNNVNNTNNTNNTNNANNTNNTNNTNNCMPESNQELCAAEGATCGMISVEDRCGATRDVTCGMCAAPETCNDQNTCECVEDEAAFCARFMKDCGMVTETDLCGNMRTVDCGTCMDNETCGNDNVCECPCRIMGQCVPDGAANPENPCEVCDPATSTMEWTTLGEGSACDDGLACTQNTTCNANGACVGDQLADTCLIEGACYMDGDEDPASECRTCDSANDTGAWTSVAQGTNCDDSLACTSGEACDGQGECVASNVTAGTCTIDDACYNQGEFNPNNPCEVCNPAEDQAGWSDVSENTACDDGLTCTSNTTCDGAGSCVGDIMAGTCAIDGNCYNQDEANPNSVCEVCDAAALQTDWTAASDGTTCDDGFACTATDTCTGGICAGVIDANSCLIDGECYADGESSPTGRVCLICDVSEDQDEFTQLANGTPCDDGLDCTGDGTCNPGGACRDGTAMAGTCAIDGACYTDGDVNPMNECESCQAALDNADWSPRTGIACDDMLTCTTNDTCSLEGECLGDVDTGSCAIDDTCYADAAINPNNPCEVCDSSASATEWSDVGQGMVCDDGLTCTSNTTCDGNGTCSGGTVSTGNCAIDGACFGAGDSNPDNDCEVCDDTNSQTMWSGDDGALCSSDGDGLSCTGVCDQTTCVSDIQLSSCVIDGACYADGDTNPMNPCESCSADDSTTDWTVAADGDVCGMGGQSICCSGACIMANACP